MECRLHRASGNSRPPLLPPGLRGKALLFLVRIHAMPVLGGQPLPRGLFSRPAPGRRAPARSPIRHVVAWPRLHRPVGFVVAFLRRPRRSRSGAGWGSPRTMSRAWRPVRRQTVVAAFEQSRVRKNREREPEHGKCAVWRTSRLRLIARRETVQVYRLTSSPITTSSRRAGLTTETSRAAGRIGRE